jgi:hypothetical protein
LNQGASKAFTICPTFVLSLLIYCRGVTLQFRNSQEILLKNAAGEQMLAVLVSSFGQDVPLLRVFVLWLLCPFRIDTADTKAF